MLNGKYLCPYDLSTDFYAIQISHQKLSEPFIYTSEQVSQTIFEDNGHTRKLLTSQNLFIQFCWSKQMHSKL